MLTFATFTELFGGFKRRRPRPCCEELEGRVTDLAIFWTDHYSWPVFIMTLTAAQRDYHIVVPYDKARKAAEFITIQRTAKVTCVPLGGGLIVRAFESTGPGIDGND